MKSLPEGVLAPFGGSALPPSMLVRAIPGDRNEPDVVLVSATGAEGL